MHFRKTEFESKAGAAASTLAALPELPVFLVFKYWAGENFVQSKYYGERLLLPSATLQLRGCTGEIEGS